MVLQCDAISHWLGTYTKLSMHTVQSYYASHVFLVTESAMRIDLLHKSHDASVPYPTMHHFVTEMCTFLLENGALWDVCLMHYGISVAICEWCHAVKKTLMKSSMARETWKKTCILAYHNSEHCSSWWPGDIRFLGICRCSDDQHGIPNIYETGKWKAEYSQ